jgi:formyltetrahydrofolate hydrolase
VVEKKLSVLRSALTENPNSIVLMIKRLKVLAEISDPATVDKEWRDLVQRYPSNVVVLKSYVRFLSTQFSTFSVAKIIDALSSCVEKFRTVKTSREDHILFVIHLVSMLCNFSFVIGNGAK